MAGENPTALAGHTGLLSSSTKVTGDAHTLSIVNNGVHEGALRIRQACRCHPPISLKPLIESQSPVEYHRRRRNK